MQKALLYTFGTVSLFLVAVAVGLTVMNSYRQVEKQRTVLGAKIRVSPTPVEVISPQISPVSQPMVLAQGDSTGNVSPSPRNIVIFNNQDLQTLWQEIYGPLESAQTLPIVDFTKNAVIAVFAGQRSTGGYQLSFNDVVQEADITVVHFTELTPGEDCFTTAAMSSPFLLVQVPNTGKTFKIALDKQVGVCR